MQIINSLFGNDLGNLSRALGRTSERQGLLENNLANANVPGYKRKDMDFGIALDSASSSQHVDGMMSQLRGGGNSNRTGVRTDQGDVRMDGNSVDVEQEVMSITETQYHYEMLANMTSGYFADIKAAIRGGN